MKTGFTQAERLGCYFRATMYQVMLLLQWTEAEYTAYKYRMGLEYLKLEVPEAEQQREIMATSQYWGWWKLEWYERETVWLALVQAELEKYEPYLLIGPDQIKCMHKLLPSPKPFSPMANVLIRRKCYKILHDATELAKAAEMATGYDRMMKELTKH